MIASVEADSVLSRFLGGVWDQGIVAAGNVPIAAGPAATFVLGRQYCLRTIEVPRIVMQIVSLQ